MAEDESQRFRCACRRLWSSAENNQRAFRLRSRSHRRCAAMQSAHYPRNQGRKSHPEALRISPELPLGVRHKRLDSLCWRRGAAGRPRFTPGTRCPRYRHQRHHLAMSETDRFGDLIGACRVGLSPRGKTSDQAKELIGDTVVYVAAQAKGAHKTRLLGEQHLALTGTCAHDAHVAVGAPGRVESPGSSAFCNYWQYCTSLLRPGSYFICRASTSQAFRPPRQSLTQMS